MTSLPAGNTVAPQIVQPPAAQRPATMQGASGGSPGDLSLYVAVWTIDGVKHTFRGYTHSLKTLKKHLKHVISTRNHQIPSEKAEIKDEDFHFGVTADEAEKIENEVRTANSNETVSTDLNPETPNILLHKSVQEIKDSAETEAAENITQNLA